MYVVLAGGVGAARFLQGLVQVVPPEAVTVIVNTGDDYHLHGLHISPDIDINLYTLAGAVHPEQGWGLAGDTFQCLESLTRYTDETWFRLGDRDLATHIFRTALLKRGQSLTAVTAELARRWNLGLRFLPMTDQPFETRILTPAGEMHFQEYLVKHRTSLPVEGVRFAGSQEARPAPGVLEAIAGARAILIPPSNPIVSVGTILSVPGIREAVAASPAPKVAVSPIIGGRTVKGPADKLLQALGHAVSPLGVAACYLDFLTGLVIDREDAALAETLRLQGLQVAVLETWMTSPARSAALAQAALELAGVRVFGSCP